MKLQFISFQSQDHFKLPALLFEPVKKTKKVAIYLHGNGSGGVFYSPDKMNTIANELTKKNIAFFPFNNRGANYMIRLKQVSDDGEEERVMQGTSYELISDCLFDIEGSIEFLKTKGYREFYLIGESTGANKIVTYHYYKKKNPVSKYILLSGGDDTGLVYADIGRIQFMKALETAKEMIKRGRSEELVPKTIIDFPITWKSLYDMINPEGDYNVFPFNEALHSLNLSKKKLFREYKTIDKPTLVIYGEKDEYCYGNVNGCVDLLKRETGHPEFFEYRIISNADHGFSKEYETVARVIGDWLT